jgi:hypothetical protein
MNVFHPRQKHLSSRVGLPVSLVSENLAACTKEERKRVNFTHFDVDVNVVLRFF